LNEATLSLEGGLDTPRIRAILGGAYLALGDAAAAAAQIKIHIDLVTTELVGTSPLSPGSSMSLGLVPGRTYDIPIAAQAGEQISITTSSQDFTDTILVLLARRMARPSWQRRLRDTAGSSGSRRQRTYRLRVTSFEERAPGSSGGEQVSTRVRS
jgi:hypothetical protein